MIAAGTQQVTAQAIATHTAEVQKSGQGEREHGFQLRIPRVGHKKSRKGCAQCKKRHVKCNEEAPCSNCRRHGVACSLAGGPIVAREDSRRAKEARRRSATSSSEATATGESLLGQSPLEFGPHLVLPGQVVEVAPPSPMSSRPQHIDVFQHTSTMRDGPLYRLTAQVPRDQAMITWHGDVQLMHHYMSYTKGVLGETSDQALIVHMWKQELPKLAFSHDHVLNALLGLTALHQASVMNEGLSSVLTSAVAHVDLAEKQFERASSECSIEAATATFVYRWLVLLFACGMRTLARLCGTKMCDLAPRNTLDMSADLVILAEEVKLAVSNTWLLISQGTFTPILTRGWQAMVAPSLALLEELGPGLNHLHYMLGVEAMLPSERTACALAVDDLRGIQQNLQPQPGLQCSVGSVLCWPKQQSTLFADMIRRRVPQALVILSYHSVMVHLLRDRWWIHGSCGHVLRDIEASLDDAWQDWIQWPVHAVAKAVEMSALSSNSSAIDLYLGHML